jgi:hypothetical protein
MRRVSISLRNMGKIKPRLLPLDDAAYYIGMAPKTLRNRISRKAENPLPIKPKKQGRKVVFDIRDLDKYADSLPYAGEE